MAGVRNLLSAGTSKLGKSIYGFAIPARSTCPGKTTICSSSCYATHGRFVTGKVQRLMRWRYEESKKASFTDAMCDEIFRRGVLVLRMGVSGDFYSPTYTAKWVEIARRSPNTRLFGYTRSWRIAPIAPYLHALAALENVRLWYSADAEAYPDDVPKNVRVAYLQHDAVVPDRGDLIFQVRKQRAKPGTISLPLICPQETPEGKAKGSNCANCALCWR